MDGMLSEWERMLPDPGEIDDLDHSDLLDNELPSIFGGKNQSPSILETANIDEIRTGEITQRQDENIHHKKDSEGKSNARETTLKSCSVNLRTDEGVTTAMSLEGDACEKTVELIDELNGNTKTAVSIKSTSMIKTHTLEKKYENNASGCDKNSSGAINGVPTDGKMENRFETCMDSPLQISDVRTIDIPAEKEADCTMRKSSRKYIMASEMSQTPSLYCDEKAESFNVKINDTGTKYVAKTDEANKDLTTDVVQKIAEDNHDNRELNTKQFQFSSSDLNSFSKDSNTATTYSEKNIAYGNSSLNNDASSVNGYEREASSENTILLAIKEEPMDYEEYGKTPENGKTSEFHSWQIDANKGESSENMSNFYNNMGGENEEFDCSYPRDYKITENGLFQCVYCSSKLSNYTHLQNHMRERHMTKYQCKHCERSFYRSQELAIHCRIHHTPDWQDNLKTSNHGKAIIRKKKAKALYDDDGNQFYKCAYCGKKFYIQQAMASHVRNEHHYNFKKKETSDENGGVKLIYTCIYCDLTFHKKKELSLHTKLEHPDHFKGRKKANVLYDNNGRQIYRCAYCDRTFHIQQAMASHVKNAHCTVGHVGYTRAKDKSKTRIDKRENSDVEVLIKKGDDSEVFKNYFTKSEESTQTDSKSGELTKMGIKSEEPSEICTKNETVDNVKCENEAKQKSREFSKRTLPYKNMLFEHDTSQIEENLTNSDCSLKRELKSNQIYHCSKCRKWFYREKQAVNHELACTAIKQEQSTPEKTQQDVVEENEVEDKHSHRQTYLKQQKEMREKMAIENKIQSDIVKKLREKMVEKRKKMAPIQINQRGNGDVGKKLSSNALPRFFCRYCPASHEEGKSMNLHLVKHLGEVLRTVTDYRCRICKNSFPHAKKMLYHLQHHTTFDIPNLYKQQTIPECNICGQPFVNLHFLRKHEKTHGRDLDNKATVKMSLDAVIESGITKSAITNPSYLTGNTSRHQRGSNSTVLTGQNSKGGVLSNERVEIKKGSVNLDDIPFQCGMCLSRFPNSQYLLHHITLHMQGPYVFSIEVDKKGQGSEENKEKIPSPNPLPGMISFAGRSYSEPSDIQADCNVRIIKSATGSSKAVSLDERKTERTATDCRVGQSTGSSTVISTGASTVLSTGTSATVLSTGHSTALSSGTLAVSKANTTIQAIANDHMYTTSLLPKNLKSIMSTAKQSDGSLDDDSATESASSSDDESSAYYDTDENIEIENFLTAQKRGIKRKKSVKKDIKITRVANFKRCFDIAGGQWFECPYCLNMSENQRDFEIHMLNHCQGNSASKKMAQCGICERKFVSKWHLSKHMEHSHKHNSYRCSFCGEGFASSSHVIDHMQQVHH